MSYKIDQQTIKDPFLDRRIKMLPCQKEMVFYWHYKIGTSIADVAKIFKVSKRTIQFILFPDRLEKNIELREERGGWKQYYDKIDHAADIKRHRIYKKRILTII